MRRNKRLLAGGVAPAIVISGTILLPNLATAHTPPAPPPAGFTFHASVLDADRVRFDWQTTRTDIIGWSVCRDGFDDSGTGLWATDKAAAARGHTFNPPIAGMQYTFTLIPRTVTGDLPPITVTATAEVPKLEGWSGP